MGIRLHYFWISYCNHNLALRARASMRFSAHSGWLYILGYSDICLRPTAVLGPVRSWLTRLTRLGCPIYGGLLNDVFNSFKCGGKLVTHMSYTHAKVTVGRSRGGGEDGLFFLVALLVLSCWRHYNHIYPCNSSQLYFFGINSFGPAAMLWNTKKFCKINGTQRAYNPASTLGF